MKNYLRIIENRTIALTELTEELFRYTVIISGKEDMEFEAVNINGILEESISSYYAALKQRNIVPKISMPEKKVVRRLNANALSRIFSNIISNAMKYSDGDLSITPTEKGRLFFRIMPPV